MCGGGGGQRATIKEPDYKAMDEVAKKTFEAMRNAQSKDVELEQSWLVESVERQGKVAEKLRDRKVANAKMIGTEEARIAAMIGTPPPSEGAKAPVLGDSRTRVTSSGRGRAGMRAVRPPLQLPTGRV